MKRFKKMLEVASSTGVMDDKNSLDTKIFFDCVNQNEVFVFQPKGIKQTDIPEAHEELDAPFKVFTIELSGQKPLTSSDPVTSKRVGFDTLIWCLMVVEISPKQYRFFALTEGRSEKGSRFNILALDEMDKGMHDLAYSHINRLAQDETGVELVRERVRLKTPSGKRTHTLRKIIHVKQRNSSPEYLTSREVDWSHRWSVRGHWRACKSIGKDRDDNYCVEGFTWVKSHEKGPEGLPLIKKQRLVK